MRFWLLLLILMITPRLARDLSAHHSLTDYDLTQTVSVTGVVSRVDWMNPHAWIFVKVSGPDGNVAQWGFEMGSPSELIRRGWSRQDLKQGDPVTIQGVPARRGGNMASARHVLRPGGQEIFTGPRKDEPTAAAAK